MRGTWWQNNICALNIKENYIVFLWFIQCHVPCDTRAAYVNMTRVAVDLCWRFFPLIVRADVTSNDILCSFHWFHFHLRWKMKLKKVIFNVWVPCCKRDTGGWKRRPCIYPTIDNVTVRLFIDFGDDVTEWILQLSCCKVWYNESNIETKLIWHQSQRLIWVNDQSVYNTFRARAKCVKLRSSSTCTFGR